VQKQLDGRKVAEYVQLKKIPVSIEEMFV
jgi:hypothetical protein